jgi:hypothetical protein
MFDWIPAFAGMTDSAAVMPSQNYSGQQWAQAGTTAKANNLESPDR